MKKIAILAIAFMGLVPFVNAESTNHTTTETSTISMAERKTVTAYKGKGVIISKSIVLEGSGNSWELISGNDRYPVYERYTTIKGVTYTHYANGWAFNLYD